MKRLISCFLVLTSLCAGAVAQSSTQPKGAMESEVDAVMKQQMSARHIPGGAVAVVRHGEIILVKAYGLANVEDQVPVTPNTVFELASVTKQFTATAVMMLVQDGKVSLDDPVGKVLDPLPAAWNKLTIRQILSHTAGLPEFAKPESHFDFRQDHTPRDLLKLVANAPLDFEPGARYSYSNTGYVLAGLLIEKLSGEAYGTFLRDRIFDPLAMKDTRVNERSAIIPNRARGYTLNEYKLQNADYVSPTNPYAAGALVSTANDMAKWMQAQGSEKLLARANWEQMWTATKLNDGTTAGYGLGWNVRTTWSRVRVEQAGGIQGFATNVTRFLADDLSVVYLLNSDVSPGTLGRRIFSLYLPATKYNPPKPIADTDTATTEMLKRVTAGLSQGTGEPDWFTTKVQNFYFPDRIKTRKDAFDGMGPLQSFDLIEAKDDNGRQKRTYRAVFGTTPTLFTYWLTPDKKIDDDDFEVE